MKHASSIVSSPDRKEEKPSGDDVVKSWDTAELKSEWRNHPMTKHLLNTLQDIRMMKLSRAEQLATNATQKDLRLSDIQPLLAASQTINEVIELIEGTK